VCVCVCVCVCVVLSLLLSLFFWHENNHTHKHRTKPKTATLFDLEKLATCVEHANKVANTYGVTIISINVVGAVPADTSLQSSLAQVGLNTHFTLLPFHFFFN